MNDGVSGRPARLEPSVGRAARWVAVEHVRVFLPGRESEQRFTTDSRKEQLS